jgi:hypothetical protein
VQMYGLSFGFKVLTGEPFGKITRCIPRSCRAVCLGIAVVLVIEHPE